MNNCSYDRSPEIFVVEEFGSVYVIPPLQPPIRFNLSGSLIWRLAAESRSIDEIIADYAAYYECGADEVTGEVAAFLNDMVRRGFLAVKEGIPS